MGKFVEFFGSGVAELSIADRATISNMCPEYGATVGFFPVDNNSLIYLRQTSEYITYCSIQVHFVYLLFLYSLPSHIQVAQSFKSINYQFLKLSVISGFICTKVQQFHQQC